MSLLSVRDLSLSASESSLVGPLSFDLEAGEKLGIIGESGSGKSLTALSIMGLLPTGISATGEVTVADHQIIGARDSAIRPLRGKTMAMVFQEPMSALDPLMRISAQLTHAGARDIAAALEEVDLDADLASRFPHQLSGGQRQRVLLAMAMAGSPDVLICDEPTTALDATTQDGVLRVIERVTEQRGTALLFITHDLNVIQRMCPRVLVMRDGYIVEEGRTERVLTQPRHAYTQELVSASQPADFALTPAGEGKDVVVLEGIGKQHGSQAALARAPRRAARYRRRFRLRQNQPAEDCGGAGCPDLWNQHRGRARADGLPRPARFAEPAAEDMEIHSGGHARAPV